MINQQFIFSDKLAYRFRRHLVFWTCWWLFFTTLHSAQPYNGKIAYFSNLPYTITESFLLLIPHIILTSYLIYFILPYYLLKNKYWKAVALTIPFLLVCLIINMYMVNEVNPKILKILLPEHYLSHTKRPPMASFYMSLLNTSKGALTAATMALGIKFIKHWYQKEQGNLKLQKENAQAQLQLLTAQVHPHFLFNTLNNIYSQTQTESPKGSRMIMELSDLLRYILTEGNKPMVLLKKELLMIKNYINLEKIRYGNKLDLHIVLPQDTGAFGIAPLILLPFVENCFKHGASRFLKAPWVSLSIHIEQDVLFMKLMNGKDNTQVSPHQKSGTGINNVKKRLQLLYPDRHQIEIINEPDVFIVNLSVTLSIVPAEAIHLEQLEENMAHAH
ncbi:MAG TPA: histidine kinase [Flavisolibacter sp.]|nr:histidine kinase [Flavisolibacter sp.]